MTARTLDTRAVLDFPLSGVALIEASAGTGKTYTIANLYLRHVVEGREVGQLLVVTFTNDATDELRGRIRARLFEALDRLGLGEPPKDPFLAALIADVRARDEEELVARRLRLAVRAMDEAAIYTIHGFCQRALTELAFNSGQQFRLEILTDDGDLWREAVQDWWRRTGYPLPTERARLFVEALCGLDDFIGSLQPLLGAESPRLLPDTPPLDEVLDGYEPLLARCRALADEWLADGERLKSILRDSKRLTRNKDHFYGPRLEAVFAVLDAWAANPEPTGPPAEFSALTPAAMEKNAKKAQDPALEDPYFLACGDAADALAGLRRDLRAAALTDAAAYARTRVGEVKDRRQALSYNDLLTRMRDALAGPGGAELAANLRQRFPVAMIDEFQDTDPIQYAIFRALYLGRPECALIMIGDPKQAIYSFRGGDIFTYMQAKRDVGAEAMHTLDTNWRSTPEVVSAVNALFGNRPEDAFVYGDAIPFHPARAAEKDHARLHRDGAPQAALTLWTVPETTTASGRPKGLSKDEISALCHAAVADEIARLIAEGRAGTALIGERPLQPRDVAVLVRTSREAANLREVLAGLGVGAVSVGRDGVFASAEAVGLSTLLQAVSEPRDRDLARLALASPLLGLDYLAIAETSADEAAWTDWIDRLLSLNETWRRRGFMAMFQQMLRRLDLAAAIARGETPDRRLTNLLHLGELLARAAKTLAGIDALLTWYRRRMQEAADKEGELRLESDAELVQIVTIHSSKGLQYPVVFVPYLWGCRPRTKKDLVGFHDNGEACLDSGSDDIDRHLCLAEQERLAEDVRLAYVALTRAESAIYLVWGRAGSGSGKADETALGYLLHPTQTGAQLAVALPNCFSGVDDLGPDLARLADSAGGAVALAPIPQPQERYRLAPDAAAARLSPRTFTGDIRRDWRVASFSSLTRNLHQSVSVPGDEPEDDPALRFPAGSHVGSYLHLLLELIDFQGDIPAQVLEHSERISPRFNLDHERWGRDAATLLHRVIETPLSDDGLRLADLPRARRLNELQFDFATGPVDLAALDRLLAEDAATELPLLDAETFRGMVNGVIDLVFEHDGRYYIADYKSNWLGGRFDHYAPEALRRAVHERRYDLQYLLYTVALHRFLARRVPDYDYERRFGGVYYLFLRGMRPRTGPARGVYARRPDPDLVTALDRAVFGPDMEEAAS